MTQSFVLLILTYYAHSNGKSDLLKGFMCILMLNISFLYVIILQYLSLGIDIDIYSFFNHEFIVDIITLIPFLWSFLSIWPRMTLWRILDIKLIIVDFLNTVLPEIHIYLLKYKIYEVIMEKIHKTYFVWLMFVIKHSYIYSENYRQKPVSRLIFNVYKYPILIDIIILISFNLEFMLKHGVISTTALMFCLFF